jgi:hypothetical protein
MSPSLPLSCTSRFPGALIGTSAQCHIVESGVKHKARSKLDYDQKSAFTNGFFSTALALALSALVLLAAITCLLLWIGLRKSAK